MNFIKPKYVELKKEYSDSVLKSVSAFSNYDGGKIIIGIDEKNKAIVGVNNYINGKLEIEQRINDSLTPRPLYKINVVLDKEKHLLEIVVYPGLSTPYLYKGIAYQRSDTSTLPVDQMGLIELSLKGKNISYDQLGSEAANLEFNVLEEKLRKIKSIETFDQDILITLGLFSNNEYNIAAELLADNNNLTNLGIDIVRFGHSISVFVERKILTGISVLRQYDETLAMFRKYFPEVEVIEGFNRVKKTAIPYEAFRESVANAIAHRNYLINSFIKIEMFDNRIEIISPGGLPAGVSRENYLRDNLSIPRNITLSRVLNILNIIERFGTGIRRINEAYFNYDKKPNFIIKDTFIKVILPNVMFDDRNMNEEIRILNMLDIKIQITRFDVENLLNVNKSRAMMLLNKLKANNLIAASGEGKSTIYIRRA